MRLTYLFVVALTLLTTSSNVFAKPRGEALFNLCSSCHGAQGLGNKDLGAPSIAGLPEWYITKQLETFSAGVRGKHPEDDAGNRMRPMARTLQNAEDIKLVSEYVASLTPAKPVNTLNGNAEKGKALFAVCVTCHGANGEGNQTLHAPPLKLTNDWYLLRQLHNFKNKMRGQDPVKDPFGASMAGMAATLADEQAMKDVITYVQSLAGAPEEKK